MKVHQLNHKLPLNFTGGIILDPDDSSEVRYLLLFQDGMLLDYTVGLCSMYLDQDLPGYVRDWLSWKGCSYTKIYTDVTHIISSNDLSKILSQYCGHLLPEMDCVRK